MDLVAGRTFADERRPIRHVDPVLLLVTAALTIVGLLAIYSSTRSALVSLGADPMVYVKKQVVALVLGILLLLIIATFDYRFFKVYAGFIYAGTVLTLVMVRVPGIGSSANGAQRWFQFAGFQLTPSEFAKIALVLMLATMLSELRTSEPMLPDLIRVCGVAIVPMFLVFIQPDIGTTIVLAAIVVGILVVAGTRTRHLLALALTAIVMIALAFQLHVIRDYQLARLTGFLDPQNSADTTAYNRQQAEIAVGSGGIFGRGYLAGTQTNLNYVPEQHTDFIFTVVGEEFGFVGAAFVLALFAILIWRAIRISYLSKDPFGTYVAAGIAAMFAIQMFVNVGMVIGIMPITGIPLPFVSYGGTAMLANFIGVGLLLNVHMRRFK
ncbi:MAG: rod shape-determining protein RodA [Actinomycetota bacterium]